MVADIFWGFGGFGGFVFWFRFVVFWFFCGGWVCIGFGLVVRWVVAFVWCGFRLWLLDCFMVGGCLVGFWVGGFGCACYGWGFL